MNMDNFIQSRQKKNRQLFCDAIHIRTLLSFIDTFNIRNLERLTSVTQAITDLDPTFNDICVDAVQVVTKCTALSNIVMFCLSPDGVYPSTVFAYASLDSLDQTLKVFVRNKKNPTLTTEKSVNMSRYCWLPPEVSYFDNVVHVDLFCCISQYLGGMDIMALRMMSKKYAQLGSMDAVWAKKVAKYRKASCGLNLLFRDMSLFKQYVHLGLCFHYSKSRDPRKNYMGGIQDNGIASILRTPKYFPLIEHAVQRVDSGFKIRTKKLPTHIEKIGPDETGRTHRRLSDYRLFNKIKCIRHVTRKRKRQQQQEEEEKEEEKEKVTFYPDFAIGSCKTEDYDTFFPKMWLTKTGHLFTARPQNTRGQRRGGIEEFFEPFLKWTDTL